MASLTTLAKLWGIEWLYWYQPLLLLVLSLLIIFWVMYRRRQM